MTEIAPVTITTGSVDMKIARDAALNYEFLRAAKEKRARKCARRLAIAARDRTGAIVTA